MDEAVYGIGLYDVKETPFVPFQHAHQAVFVDGGDPVDYFPPMVLKPTGRKGSFGDDVGLFATQDIDEHVFMGEYAADIVPP